MLRNPTSDVLIVAYWRLSTLTQYLTWFGKPPTSTGEVHIIRDRKRIQYKYMEEENHFTQTLLPAHIVALAAAAIATLYFLSWSLTFCSLSLSLSLSFCSQIMPLFIGINGKTWGHQLWHKWWQHMGCIIFVDGWCNFHCSLLTTATLLLRVGIQVVAH